MIDDRFMANAVRSDPKPSVALREAGDPKEQPAKT